MTDQMLTRAGVLTRADDEDGREVYRIRLSTDTPLRRYVLGMGEVEETLVHDERSADMGWLASGRAPLLLEHDPGRQIGVIRSARLAEGSILADVRFSRSAEAQAIKQDVDDGVRSAVSIGYVIQDYDRDALRDDRLVVTRWKGREASVVSIPADERAGFGRADNPLDLGIRSSKDGAPPQEADMADTKAPDTPATTTETRGEQTTIDFTAERNSAAQAEAERIKAIQEEARRFMRHELGDKAIREGLSVEAFRGELLMSMSPSEVEAKTSMGFTAKEKRSYSITRLLNYLAADPTEKRRAADVAGFELEVAQDAAERAGKRHVRGTLVPHEMIGQRLDTGSAGAGGNLVGTDHLGGNFIDLLRNQIAVMNAGAMMLQNLEGNVAIPKQATSVAAGWVAENGTAPTAEMTFAQVTLSPHDVAATTVMSRRLMQQSDPSVEALVRADLTAKIALAIDEAAINGDGTSNAPVGIRNQAGVNAESLATLNLANVLGMVEPVFAANAGALPGKAWLMNSIGMRRFRSTFIDAGSGIRLMGTDNQVEGYPAVISEQLPRTLGGGSDSRVIFGAFSQLIIGMWGGFDLVADPYSLSNTGQVRITVFQTADIAVRHGAAFSYADDLAAS